MCVQCLLDLGNSCIIKDTSLSLIIISYNILASEWGIDVDPETNLYYNVVYQCYTSAVKEISEGEIVSNKSIYEDRVIHADEETFWGIIWIS